MALKGMVILVSAPADLALAEAAGLVDTLAAAEAAGLAATLDAGAAGGVAAPPHAARTSVMQANGQRAGLRIALAAYRTSQHACCKRPARSRSPSSPFHLNPPTYRPRAISRLMAPLVPASEASFS